MNNARPPTPGLVVADEGVHEMKQSPTGRRDWPQTNLQRLPSEPEIKAQVDQLRAMARARSLDEALAAKGET